MTDAGFHDWKRGDPGPGTAWPLGRRILLLGEPSFGLTDRLESGVTDWTGDDSLTSSLAPAVFFLSGKDSVGGLDCLLLLLPPVPTKKSMENPIRGRVADGGPVGVDGLFDSGVAARGIMLSIINPHRSSNHNSNTSTVEYLALDADCCNEYF